MAAKDWLVETKRRAKSDIFAALRLVEHYSKQSAHNEKHVARVRHILSETPGVVQQIDSEETRNTPLHVACNWNLADIAELMLQQGADPNAINANRWMPLHCVCGSYSDSIRRSVQILLHGGASAIAATQAGVNPIDLAVEGRTQEHARPVVAILHNAGAPMTIAAAVALSDLVSAQQLFNAGIDWQSLGTCGGVLNAAVRQCGHSDAPSAAWEVLLAFFKAGVDPEVMDSGGYNALHAACRSPIPTEVFRLILDHTRNVNAVAGDGRTALDICSQDSACPPEILKMLQAAGAMKASQLTP